MEQQSPFFGLELLTVEGHFPRLKKRDKNYPYPVAIAPKIIDAGDRDELYFPNTATFCFSSFANIEKAIIGESDVDLTVRWENTLGQPIPFGEFRSLCMAQADYFNAQLLKRGADGRVGAFDISWRMKPDAIETRRQCVPLNFFETVALNGKPSPYGVLFDF